MVIIFVLFSQSVSNEKIHENESEQQESSITIRKQIPSVDIRSNRKSMFEQPSTQTNTTAIERVNSIISFIFILNKYDF